MQTVQSPGFRSSGSNINVRIQTDLEMTNAMNNINELDHRTDMLPSVVVARNEGDGGHIFQCCW